MKPFVILSLALACTAAPQKRKATPTEEADAGTPASTGGRGGTADAGPRGGSSGGSTGALDASAPATGGRGGASGSGGSSAGSGGFVGSLDAGMLVPESDAGGKTFEAPPAPWKGADIGNVGSIKGRFAHQHNGLFVLGGGTDIGGTADSLYMVYYPLVGDGEFVVRNPGLSGPSDDAKSGGMIRASLDANAPHIFIGFGGKTAGSAFQLVRSTAGGNTTRTDYAGVDNNSVFRIVRAGNTFTLFRNGMMASTTTIAMPQTVYAGFVFSAGIADVEGGATYGKESWITYGLPTGWAHADVETNLGVAVFANNVLTLAGYGANFVDDAVGQERFGWISQSATGDTTLTAKITSMTGVASTARVGLMMREGGSSASAAHAMIYVAPDGTGLVFRHRDAPDKNVVVGTPKADLKPPIWLRLSRAGTTITGKYSTDGTTWTMLDSATVTLTAPKIGPFVNSGKYTVGPEGVNTAKIENLASTPGAQ
jgi:hypothetical protein